MFSMKNEKIISNFLTSSVNLHISMFSLSGFLKLIHKHATKYRIQEAKHNYGIYLKHTFSKQLILYSNKTYF